MAAWMLHAVCCGEEAGARNLVFFRVKWLQPAMKGTSCVRRVRLGSFGSFYVFCNLMVVPVCVVPCVSWSCGCRSHWNGCMNVACRVLWGGSRSTKPCVFPCKVAAAGDERYIVCAAGAAGVVWFLLCVCAAWMLHAVCCGEEAGARDLAFFRVKWLQPAMKGTSCVRRVRLGSFGSFYVFCNNGCSCVRSSMHFLKLWLQIALAWLHECCMPCVVGRKPEHETLCFSV